MSGDILVIGSANMDVFINTPRLPAVGENSFGTSLELLPGGKGANQAVALARLGAAVRFSAKIGQDFFGAELLKVLSGEKIDTSAVFRDAQTATGVAFIIVEANGANRIIVLPGANMAYGEAEIAHIRPAIESAAALLLQLEIPIESIARLIAIAKARSIPVIVDAGPAQRVPLELFEGVAILSPNETEAAALTGIPVVDLASAEAACKVLRTSGAAVVVIKLGDKGALVGDEQGVRHYPAYRIQAVDTTAAGDAFTAAMAWRYSRGYDIDASVRFANAVGALSATKPGSLVSLPFEREVTAFLAVNGGGEVR